RALPREDFAAILTMLADGFSTRRGRRGALIHYDAVNKMLRGRRGARLTAITSGGTIPDNADYSVLLEPEDQIIGTVNEDFAVESLAGDIFQLGNKSYRINRAWGLALRKRFCRKFNFELQAAATEDNIVLSLTTAHSFDLPEVGRYLHSASVREVLIQAMLDAPMFITRWRWVAGVSLAL